MEFEWDDAKNAANISKHGVSFGLAQEAFFDPQRIITFDRNHSTAEEKRFFCFGMVNSGILTVRFTIRHGKIRIIGAGFWREGKVKYEKENRVSQGPGKHIEGD